jgi:hypothetical protein
MMSDEEKNAEKNSSGHSRRTALKVGMGAGVGLVAWSAPSITSLGGTPVYAAGCTFVTNYKLADCRNTDQASGCTGPFSFQPLTAPPGFTWITNVGNNVCCDVAPAAILKIPDGLECKATFAIYAGPTGCRNQTGAVASNTTGPSEGFIDIPLSCLGLTTLNSQAQYSITLSCNTPGAPDECL